MSIPDPTYANVNDRLISTGLPPLDEAELETVHHLLSRMLGSAWSGYRNQTWFLMEVLAGAVTTACEDEETLDHYDPIVERLTPAPGFVPREREVRGWPEGERVLERLRLTPAQLDDLWRDALVLSEKRPQLPVSVVAEFFPPPIWFALARLLALEPAEAALRIRRYLTAFASSPPRTMRSRPRQKGENGEEQQLKRTQSGIKSSVLTIERLLVEVRQAALAGYRPRAELRALRAELDGANGGEASEIRAVMAQPSPCLVPWQVETPRFRSIIELGTTDRTDRSAPPLPEVRREWAVKSGRFAEASRWRSKFLNCGLSLYRDMIIFMLLVILGGRMGAIMRLRVCDIDFAHRFPDGRIGPAVRIYPGKTIPSDEARWKGIPDDLADWLRNYMAFTGVDRYPERRILIVGWKRVTDENGHTRSLRGEPGDAWAVDGYGSLSSPRTKHPLLPFSDGRTGGYSPHTFRHLTEQLARRVGHEWISAHPDWIGRLSDQAFADALLDHSFGEADRLGYNDLEAHRETFAREAALGIWEVAFGGAGARRAPDLAAIQDAENARDRVQAELDAVESQVGDLRRQRARLMDGAISAEEPPEVRDDEEGPGMIRALLTLVRELRLLLRQMWAERRQIAVINAELDQAAELRLELRDELVHAQARLANAFAETVPVDDLLSDAEYASLLAAAPEMTVQNDNGDHLEIIRDTLPAKQFAQALGVSEQSMRRWMAKRSCPYWSPDDYKDKVIEFSERRREVTIDQLDHSKIAPGAMREIRRLQSEAA